ncbi:MAG: hypothetical protein WC565_10840 [Parcubacteria group bacterium]
MPRRKLTDAEGVLGADTPKSKGADAEKVRRTAYIPLEFDDKLALMHLQARRTNRGLAFSDFMVELLQEAVEARENADGG